MMKEYKVLLWFYRLFLLTNWRNAFVSGSDSFSHALAL